MDPSFLPLLRIELTELSVTENGLSLIFFVQIRISTPIIFNNFLILFYTLGVDRFAILRLRSGREKKRTQKILRRESGEYVRFFVLSRWDQ